MEKCKTNKFDGSGHYGSDRKELKRRSARRQRKAAKKKLKSKVSCVG